MANKVNDDEREWGDEKNASKVSAKKTLKSLENHNGARGWERVADILYFKSFYKQQIWKDDDDYNKVVGDEGEEKDNVISKICISRQPTKRTNEKKNCLKKFRFFFFFVTRRKAKIKPNTRSSHINVKGKNCEIIEEQNIISIKDGKE